MYEMKNGNEYIDFDELMKNKIKEFINDYNSKKNKIEKVMKKKY